MSEDDNKGPNLGGGPKMPSLGDNSTTSGPSSGPSLGGGPSLGSSTQTSTKPSPSIESTPKKKKKSNSDVDVHELVRKWGVARRRVRDSLQNLMLREIQEKVRMTPVNEVFRRHVLELMEGQLTYFQEMISLINEQQDQLSLEVAERGDEVKTSAVVFENLTEIIEEEIELLKEDSPVITEYIDEDLKRFRDARVEPRASFWVIWYTAMMLREVRERSGDKLEIVLEVLMKYRPAQRRALGVFFNFADCLLYYFEPFSVEFARINPVYNPTDTGYNMAPWIKPRYGTYSQNYMEYQRFLKYYARSFGVVPGNSPDFEGGPLLGYRQWMQRSLSALEDRMRKSPLLMEHARGNTLEGMLVGLEDQLKEAKTNLQYDDQGAVINHPIGIDGAIKFIKWLFHTALNRYDTTNIAIHKDARLSLDMFDFIPDTVRWVNEYGEQIVMDWLGEDTPEEDDDDDEET